MIHPIVQIIIDRPKTIGMLVALEYFEWSKLDKYEEVKLAADILKLADLIDKMSETVKEQS